VFPTGRRPRPTKGRTPPPGNVTPSQPRHTAAFGDSQAVTSPSDVTDGNGRKPAASNGCDVVTDWEKWGGAEADRRALRMAFDE